MVMVHLLMSVACLPLLVGPSRRGALTLSLSFSRSNSLTHSHSLLLSFSHSLTFLLSTRAGDTALDAAGDGSSGSSGRSSSSRSELREGTRGGLLDGISCIHHILHSPTTPLTHHQFPPTHTTKHTYIHTNIDAYTDNNRRTFIRTLSAAWRRGKERYHAAFLVNTGSSCFFACSL